MIGPGRSSLLRSRALHRAYRFFPHRLLNRSMRAVARLQRPRWLVRAMIAHWAARARIDLDECERADHPTLESFFLRRLTPDARPLGRGFVSPVDGFIVSAGVMTQGTLLQVKGSPIPVSALVNGVTPLHALPLEAYDGGRHVNIFLSPRGYHHVHMPADGEVLSCQWLPGRFFPQNEDALRDIARVYERNERAVLRCRADKFGEFLLVLVGASLVGGIEFAFAPREQWVRPNAMTIGRRWCKGERLGHFTFGSTVVLLLPASATDVVRRADAGTAVRMGETLG
jgi:phosphatidylserine decarboxylase